MSIWAALGIAFVFWWLGFFTASLLASAKSADRCFKEDKHSD